MKTKKHLILLAIIMFAIVLSASAQEEINSELEVRFEKTERSDSITVYPLKTWVKQTINFNKHREDSVLLTIESPMPFSINQFFFPKLHISAHWNSGKEEKLNYSFTGQNLILKLPEPPDKIVLDYEYQSDLLFKSNIETIQYLATYSSHLWYFTCKDIKINQVKINVPAEVCCFANDPYKYENNQLIISPLRRTNEITFLILTKKYYDQSSFTYKKTKVDLYQSRGATFILSDTTFTAGTNQPELLKKRERTVRKAIQRITGFLDYKEQKRISVADKRATKKEKVRWGLTTQPFKNENLILIDSTMWDSNSLYHELLHAFDQNLLGGGISIQDSAYHFFGESMIEYLSIYLLNKKAKDRDHAFNNSMLVYSKSKTGASSVFGLKENQMNEEGEGTAYIVYFKTPFVIHSFAKKIGEKRFVNAFLDFCRQARIKNEASLADFETVLKAHGVTDKEWEWFMKYL